MKPLQDKLDSVSKVLEPILWELLDSFDDDDKTIFETGEQDGI
jgi:hypothetical protein